MEGLALTLSFKIHSIIMKNACYQEHEAAGHYFPGHKVETNEQVVAQSLTLILLSTLCSQTSLVWAFHFLSPSLEPFSQMCPPGSSSSLLSIHLTTQHTKNRIFLSLHCEMGEDIHLRTGSQAIINHQIGWCLHFEHSQPSQLEEIILYDLNCPAYNMFFQLFKLTQILSMS